jgi:filamentous hemagglutinin
MPRSMVDVAGTAWAFDSFPQNIRYSTKPVGEPAPEPRTTRPKEYDEIGGVGAVADNGEIKTNWVKGIKLQGAPWEDYLAESLPGARKLRPNAKTFDLVNEATREAISAKTLNTLSVSYIRKPESIYGRLKRYIDAAADYKPRTKRDLDPDLIRSKTIHLAISEYTSPVQWRRLRRARRYAREKGIPLVITRIRE